MPKKILPEKECEICGIWFTPNRSTQKYCPTCGQHSDNARRKLNANIRKSIKIYGTGRPIQLIENICKYCGKTFQTWKYAKDFCSTECQTEYRIENTVCAECGKRMIDCGEHTLTTTWFCSDECKTKHQWRIARENGDIHICKQCNKEFIRHGSATFCSKDCYQTAVKQGWRPESSPKQRICPICGTLYTETSELHNYCSEKCTNIAKQRKTKFEQMTILKKQEEQQKQHTKQKSYIENNGLCSICRTSYVDCERMQTNFRMSPKGAVFKGSLVIQCPKYTPPKQKAGH